jgi:hypothetical protein
MARSIFNPQSLYLLVMSIMTRYDSAMKTKPQSEEYARFENLLGVVLSVPKAEITRRIAEDKREKRMPKSASRAVDAPSSPS